jgi:regulator of Ty1 transposition protein 103
VLILRRRHADRTGQLWLQRLKDSGSNKRLNLIYLANGKLVHSLHSTNRAAIVQKGHAEILRQEYVANDILGSEVVQQSKARRKDDFLVAFSPVIAEATATAYKGAANEVQQKLRRVVEVWRQRQIFELPIQEAIESRIDGMLILLGRLVQRPRNFIPSLIHQLLTAFES